MAESSVPGAVGEPRTEAGRRLARHLDDGSGTLFADYILAIEHEAGGAVGEREEPLDRAELWRLATDALTDHCRQCPEPFFQHYDTVDYGEPPVYLTDHPFDSARAAFNEAADPSTVLALLDQLARLSVNEGGVAPVEPQEPR